MSQQALALARQGWIVAEKPVATACRLINPIGALPRELSDGG